MLDVKCMFEIFNYMLCCVISDIFRILENDYV